LAVKKFIVNHLPKSISKFSRIWFLRLSSKKRLAQRNELRFDVHLVDHCNLNCKGCLHFSPLSAEKYLSLQSFERDIKKISELTEGKISDMCLLGGEPLLHPDIEFFLPIARRYFPTGRINVLTNGLLLPNMPDTFFDMCKKYEIEISVSYYPVNIAIEKIKEITKRWGIRLEIRDEYREGTSTWLRQPLDITGRQDCKKSYTTCAMGNFCIQLVDGKIYQCETVAYIHYFNKYFGKNIIVNDNDYINIHSVTNIKEIFQFLCNPMPFCRHCKTKDIEYVLWDNSKKEINEWT
jgi:MoaA/NifB/PqqE/SkfB family radical SAM enzyme